MCRLKKIVIKLDLAKVFLKVQYHTNKYFGIHTGGLTHSYLDTLIFVWMKVRHTVPVLIGNLLTTDREIREIFFSYMENE